MFLPHRITALIVLILLTWTATAKKSKSRCPIGFNIAYTKHKGDDPICYRRKGPEPFKDKFVNCAGNLYTAKLYQKLNITATDLILWTDYKSMYPRGPYIDWSYTENTGDVLKTSADVVDKELFDDETCVVIDPVTNFTASKCDEMHYRYCFVKPYVDEDDMSRKGCEDLQDYYRFWSPRPSCLKSVMGVGGGTVRANWRQAKELCVKRGGSLMSKGWRYANSPVFSISVLEPTYPLGIVLSPDNTIRFDMANDSAVIPTSEWNFESRNVSTDTSYGALREDFWYLVNSSYMFYDVICERPIRLRSITMNVTVDTEGKLILRTNDTMEENKISCHTDSVTFFPKKVRVRYDGDSDVFVLKPIADGYYWCTHTDTKNVYVAESNKALFIREKQSLVNSYSIELSFKAKRFDKLEDYYRYWQMNLEEFIFYRTKYINVFGESEVSEPATAETVLKEFKASHPGLKWRDKELIYDLKLKRYVEGRSAVLHVQLNPEMMPLAPGSWGDIEVLSMKPAYYCKGLDSVPMLPLDGSTISAGCQNYTCMGDFIKGVQWVIRATAGCVTVATLRANTEIHLELPMPTAEPVTKVQNDPNWRDYDSSEESDNSTETETLPTDPPDTVPPDTDTPPTDTPPTDTPPTEAPPTDTPPTDTPPMETPPTDTLPTVTDNVTETFPQETVPTFTTTQIVSTLTTPMPEEVSTLTTPPPRPPSPPTTTTTTTTPIILPPDEQLHQVMDDLDALLNGTEPVTVEDIAGAFDQLDVLLAADDDLEFPGEFLRLLDRLGDSIELNGTHQASAVRGNIALVMADASPEEPVRGLRINARDDDAFYENAFELISDEVNTTHLATNKSEAVVQLPESVASSSRRISFVVFRNDRAFQDQGVSVNSRVLSINVGGVTHFLEGEVIDIHLSPLMTEPERNMSRACGYWHFNADETGFWSQEGCTFIRSTEEGMLDTCRCEHLTHFAEILVPRAVFSERNENVLEILTIIGCCLSIFGLCMVGVTAVLFRSWRREYSNKIWLQLCIAIFILVLCFLIVVFAHFDTYDIPCMLLGVALHYAVLASFCWMLVAAVLSYRRLVIVFTRDASHKLLRASAFSWGAPCAVVGILLSVDPRSYAGRFEEMTPSGAFCYPSGLGMWLAVYMPIAVMLVANWTLFALIVRSVFASKRIQRHGNTNEAVRCASVSCLLVFLFGLPWLFGLFAQNIVAAYLFTLTATYQGFVLFIFFVVGNKKTRDLWLNKLKIKQTRKVPVTTSTYTNRSIGVGARSDPEGVSAAVVNSSKPRSLSSPDNSRFS